MVSSGFVIGVCIVILAAASIWAWGCLRQAHGRLGREMKWLEQARASLQPEGIAGAIVPSPEGVETLLARCGLDNEVARESVVARRIRRMGSLAQTRLSGEHLLSDLASRREELHPELPRFIGSILVFLALIGTVASLYFTFSNLPDLTGQAQDAQSVAALDQLVRHISQAFFVTGAGIFCTVVVAGLNHRFTHRQDRFLLSLEEFTLDALAPVLLSHPEIAEFRRMESLQREMMNASEHLAEVVGNVGNQLGQAVRDVQEGAAQQAQAFRQTLAESATQFAGDLRATTSVLHGTSERLALTAGDLTAALPAATDAARQLAETCRAASGSLNDSSIRLQSGVQDLREMLQSLQVAINAFPLQVQALEGTTHRIGVSIENFNRDQRGSREDLQSILGNMAVVAEALRALQATTAATYQQVQVTLEDMRSAFRQEQAEFTNTVRGIGEDTRQHVGDLRASQEQMLNGIAARMEVAADKYQAETHRSLEAVHAQLAQAIHNAEGALAAMGGSADRLERTAQTLPQGAAQQILQSAEEVKHSLNRVEDRMRQSPTGTDAELSRTLAELNRQQATIAAQMARVSSALSAIEEQLRKSTLEAVRDNLLFWKRK